MSKQIKVKVITPERVVCECDVDQITLPVTDGEVTILPNHRAYIASLQIGEIIAKTDGKEENIAVVGGFLEFDNNELTILADEAERAEEIDIKKAEAAKKRAEDIKNKVIKTDEIEYATVAATLEREMSRIKIAKKYLSRKGL
ncbi:MAG TPA: F0F1 ATP synthase subunit epsilon [Candidatus Pacebacteria bacterium]|nr:F0F1 ATP synthase subunit epsilon [Candidatus Paceibacterota bacterium]